MSEQKPSTKSARDPQALSSEYHKARKQLMLWAGILFIWELVGIDLEKAKEAGGNAGAILTAIKSPQAIPWVLVVLVAYFVFKLGIEWNQCEARRREVLASRVDVGSAWVVAVLACALYAYQSISRIQVADVVQTSDKFKSAMLGVMIGVTVFTTLVTLFRKWRVKRARVVSLTYTIVFFLLSLLLFLLLLSRRAISMNYLLGGAAILWIVLGPFYYFVDRRVQLAFAKWEAERSSPQGVSKA